MENIILTPIPISDLESLIQKCVDNAISSNSVNQDQHQSKSELITIKQAAEFLSLSVPTIYSKVSKGELPFMKVSKRLYFSREDLTEYVKSGRKSTMQDDRSSAHIKIGK